MEVFFGAGKTKMNSKDKTLKRVQILLIAFVVGLVLSGITAFPLISELKILNQYLGPETQMGHAVPSLAAWISKVQLGLIQTQNAYPFIMYGTDWLAFAHLVIATVFWGPIKDPIRNKWVVEFGIIACLGILPLAFICGPIREIPFYWRLIDCSFGIFGSIPLIICWRLIRKMEIQTLNQENARNPADAPAV
jgi:hypothetical protein